MDPVSAVGLVASVTGLASFGAKAVKIAAQILETGSSDQVSSLAKAADDMKTASDYLLSIPRTDDDLDQDILLLADRSVQVAEKVAKLTGDIRSIPTTHGKAQGRSIIRQTLKTLRNKHNIGELSRQLDGVQKSLHLRLTVWIETRLEKSFLTLDDILKALGRDMSSLLSGITDMDELRNRMDTVLDNQTRGEVLAEKLAESIKHLSSTIAGVCRCAKDLLSQLHFLD
ncbi:hypothetical protein QBC47DRAFT_42568 [Echria macrotheca]|uniref:Uncharacterized protein n=1 Tax=Echria macrotheca TaxID=438768 RepID=A0AAJ0BCN0_9PEZI|nr:hypothetical protein QBC47DRAFT_42568 [Echria macrotheca]